METKWAGLRFCSIFVPDVKIIFILCGYEDNLFRTCFEDDGNVNRDWRDRIEIVDSAAGPN